MAQRPLWLTPWLLYSVVGVGVHGTHLCDAEETEDHELAEDEECHKAFVAVCMCQHAAIEGS